MEIEKEIQSLKQRVDNLEGAVSVLTGHIGRIHPELSALQEATAQRFDTMEKLVGQVASSMQTMNTQVWSLRDDLPMLIREALDASRDT